MIMSNLIGGKLLTPEDFVVNEIIHPKFLKKFRVGKKIEKMSGPYTLAKLTKRNLTTEQAIKIIAKMTKTKENEFGYAGLKDKFAVTTQYLTIRKELQNIETDNLKMKIIGKTDKRISTGDLIGNEFIITLHGCKNLENLPKIIEMIKKDGMPNYFGPQRFSENNEEIGRKIIETKKSGFDKKKTKFFIHAYQSWIFNKMLDEYIEKNKKPAYIDAPIIGYDSKIANDAFGKIIKRIMEKEKIATDDFRLDELSISCTGGKRKAFIKIDKIEYETIKDAVKLKFALPKGSYATVLIIILSDTAKEQSFL